MKLQAEIYQDYLKSDYWKTIKKKMWEKYHGCQICGIGDRVEVHHLCYDHFYKEHMSQLRLLCRKCHHRQHYPLHGGKTPLTEKALRKRYYYLKWTYPIRTFKPSMFFDWIYRQYIVSR